jgi:uncharacterized protein (TIGR02646 family)
MIFVDRDCVPVPAALVPLAEAYRKSIYAVRSPSSYPEIRQALNDLFRSKCAFCETAIPQMASGVIDCFRPISGALNLDGSSSPDHYSWLRFEWSNLYLVCNACSQMKGRRFPVPGGRAKPSSTGEALRAEKALLLDPCVDNPADHLVFLETGQVVGTDVRGRTSIEVFGLNRASLVEERRTTTHGIHSQFARALENPSAQAFKKTVDDILGESSTFLALRRQLLAHLARKAPSDRRELVEERISGHARVISKKEQKRTRKSFERAKKKQESYSIEVSGPKHDRAYYAGAKRIESIEIRNFKAIANLRLAFPSSRSDHESWLMLIGENGTGKSSILQALALALMGEEHANNLGLDASDYVKTSEHAGFVKIELTNLEQPIELSFKKKSRLFKVFPREPKVLLLAYGATRLLARSQDANDAKRPIRIKSLFDPTAPLSSVEAWMADPKLVDKQRFKEIAKALRRLLMLDPKTPFERKRGEVTATPFEAKLPLRALSDGFQSVLALSLDIMMTMFDKWPSMMDAEGIVLLDEIEVHLHPRWKIEIVKRLRRVFPRVAFVATTHDPLCLRGLNRREIVVLRRDSDKQISALDHVPSIAELRADQVLTSLFGLASTRDDRVDNDIARYSRLLGKTRDAREEQQFQRLREKLQDSLHRGETPVHWQVEQAVQKTLLAMTSPQKASRPLTKSAKAQQAEIPEHLQLEMKRQLHDLLRIEGQES